MGCTVELLGTNGRQKPDRLVLRVCRGLQAGASHGYIRTWRGGVGCEGEEGCSQGQAGAGASFRGSKGLWEQGGAFAGHRQRPLVAQGWVYILS